MLPFKASILLHTQSDDPIRCDGKPVERASEIKGYAISLVRSTGFPWQLIGSSDRVQTWIGALKAWSWSEYMHA